MQGLSDGYFVIPATLPAYLTTIKPGSVTTASRNSRPRKTK